MSEFRLRVSSYNSKSNHLDAQGTFNPNFLIYAYPSVYLHIDTPLIAFVLPKVDEMTSGETTFTTHTQQTKCRGGREWSTQRIRIERYTHLWASFRRLCGCGRWYAPLPHHLWSLLGEGGGSSCGRLWCSSFLSCVFVCDLCLFVVSVQAAPSFVGYAPSQLVRAAEFRVNPEPELLDICLSV